MRSLIFILVLFSSPCAINSFGQDRGVLVNEQQLSRIAKDFGSKYDLLRDTFWFRDSIVIQQFGTIQFFSNSTPTGMVDTSFYGPIIFFYIDLRKREVFEFCSFEANSKPYVRYLIDDSTSKTPFLSWYKPESCVNKTFETIDSSGGRERNEKIVTQEFSSNDQVFFKTMFFIMGKKYPVEFSNCISQLNTKLYCFKVESGKRGFAEKSVEGLRSIADTLTIKEEEIFRQWKASVNESGLSILSYDGNRKTIFQKNFECRTLKK